MWTGKGRKLCVLKSKGLNTKEFREKERIRAKSLKILILSIACTNCLPKIFTQHRDHVRIQVPDLVPLVQTIVLHQALQRA